MATILLVVGILLGVAAIALYTARRQVTFVQGPRGFWIWRVLAALGVVMVLVGAWLYWPVIRGEVEQATAQVADGPCPGTKATAPDGSVVGYSLNDRQGDFICGPSSWVYAPETDAALPTPIPVVEPSAGTDDPAVDPATDPQAPVAPQVNAITALCYDEDGACGFPPTLLPGQNELAALPVRRAQEAVRLAATDQEAQEAMAKAVGEIQQLAGAAGATTREGESLNLEFGVTWLVWCSNTSSAQVPNDVALPFGMNHFGLGELMIWAPPAHYVNAPDPSHTTFTGCEGSPFWAVALR